MAMATERHVPGARCRVVLIGGSGRCGSTMLKQLLSKHPDLHVIPNETNPHPYRMREWYDMRLAPAVEEAKDNGIDVVVEKSPQNVLYYEGIALWLARRNFQPVYMHMTRDADRTAESIMKFGRIPIEHWKEPFSYEHAKLWADFSNKHGTFMARKTGGIVVDFDELVTDPAPAMANICDALEIGPPSVEMWEFPFNETKSAHYVAPVEAKPENRFEDLAVYV